MNIATFFGEKKVQNWPHVGDKKYLHLPSKILLGHPVHNVLKLLKMSHFSLFWHFLPTFVLLKVVTMLDRSFLTQSKHILMKKLTTIL